MQIFGPFRVSTTQGPSGVQRLQPQAQPSSAAPLRSAGPGSAGPVDQLDLSSASRLDSSSAMASTNRAAASLGSAMDPSSGEIRIDRVADLRRQIASGNYDTAEKLDVALERMLDRFG